MSEVRIAAQVRTEFGKGGARRTRRAGRIPAVLYGHGEAPRHISLPVREFTAALKGGGLNTLLTLDFDGGSALALPKAIQRDPVRDTYEHIDLLIVRRGEKVTVDVQVIVTGEPAPDTLVNQDLNAVSLEVEATNIPESVEVDIAGATVGESITAGALSLPAGATLVTDPDALVVGFLATPTAEQLEAELAEAEAEAGIEHEATDAELAEQAEAEAEVEEGEGGAAGEDAPAGDAEQS